MDFTGEGLFGYNASANMLTTELDMNETDSIEPSDAVIEPNAETVDSEHGISFKTIQLIVVTLCIIMGTVMVLLVGVCCCKHCRAVQEMKSTMKRMRSLQKEQYLL